MIAVITSFLVILHWLSDGIDYSWPTRVPIWVSYFLSLNNFVQSLDALFTKLFQKITLLLFETPCSRKISAS